MININYYKPPRSVREICEEIILFNFNLVDRKCYDATDESDMNLKLLTFKVFLICPESHL